ncbi:hypothetical protein G6F40_017493 [Rhizopus arrhizus]|nr:hypothetical protein G6F40_017493 [Rhizopus arrhizus]
MRADGHALGQVARGDAVEVQRGVFQWQEHLTADEAPASGCQDDRQDQHDDRGQFRQVVALVGRFVDLGGAPFSVRQEGDDPASPSASMLRT